VNVALNALKKEQINKAALVVFNTNDLGNEFWKSLGFQKRDDLFYRNISINEQNV
jgi:ribosomal protein S18 acetylase RimI-like enzyme